MPDPTTLQAEIDGLYTAYAEEFNPKYRTQLMERLGYGLAMAWPTLSAALTEMRRKAEALDRISGLLCKHGRSSQSSVDLISAICDTIVEATPDRSGQKETT